MSSKEKSKFEDLAKSDKARYDREMENYPKGDKKGFQVSVLSELRRHLGAQVEGQEQRWFNFQRIVMFLGTLTQPRGSQVLNKVL